MANYTLKLDLLKIRNSFVDETKDKNGVEKKCLVIPIEDSDLFLGEKGCYLSLAIYETSASRFGETHFVKQKYSKEFLKRMPQEFSKNTPYFGNLFEDKGSNGGNRGNYNKQQSEQPYKPKQNNSGGGSDVDLPW